MKLWTDCCCFGCIVFCVVALLGIRWCWIVALQFLLQAVSMLVIRNYLKEKKDIEDMTDPKNIVLVSDSDDKGDYRG